LSRESEDDGTLNYRDFIAEVGAMAMEPTTYQWILDHEFALARTPARQPRARDALVATGVTPAGRVWR
jgi:hypothetical protein